MAEYNPPTEDLVIFDSSVFQTTNEGAFNQAQADLLYLHYPIGQGTETLPGLVVGGGASVGANLGVGGNVVVTGNIELQNANNEIYNDGTNNTIITFPVGKSCQIGQTGFSRLAVSATGVQINGIPLSFDSTNNKKR